MRLRTSVLLAMAALSGSCAPAAVDVSSWTGTYEATFHGTITVVEPAGLPAQHTVSGATMTVSAGGTRGVLLFAWRRDDEPTNGQLTFSANGDDATFVPGSAFNMPFTGELSNGALATMICTTCTAHRDGDTIVQVQSGTAGGMFEGTPWTGTYTGTWIGTRATHDGGTRY